MKHFSSSPSSSPSLLPLWFLWPPTPRVFIITTPSFFCPFLSCAVRPRFTEPAKMRKRVIARPVGSSVRLKCAASGNPRPDIVWLKDSRRLADEDGGQKTRWTLSLKNLTPEHSGKYTCHVSNPAGQINATYKVEVIRESSCGGGGGHLHIKHTKSTSSGIIFDLQ